MIKTFHPHQTESNHHMSTMNRRNLLKGSGATLALGTFGALSGTSVLKASTASATSIGGRALDYAMGHAGAPYREGAKGPSVFDCSGLIQYCSAQAGLNIGSGGTYVQAFQKRNHLAPIAGHGQVQNIDSHAQRGDVVFFFDSSGYPQHVGFYYGGGRIFDAYNYGYTVGSRPFSMYHFASCQVYRLFR